MKDSYTGQLTPIQGYFRRSKQTMTWKIILILGMVLIGLLAVVGVIEQQLSIIFGAVVGLMIIGGLAFRRHNDSLVSVILDPSKLTIKGGGYHIEMKAPFRYQTGIQRIRASRRAPEFYYVRMVLDVYGKPLVLEERVPSGVQPPRLDEIISLSDALGIAELSNIKPYPGTLWLIIQRFEELSSQSTREQIERDIENLYRIGEQQLNSESYYAAIQTFSEIIRLTPESPYPYYNRGMAYFYFGGNHDKALRDLTTVIRLKPKFDKAYRMRGLVKADEQDWVGVRDDLTEAIRLNPDKSELYNIRGGASYSLQDYQSAVKDFDRAIELGGMNPEPYHNRGLVKHRLGDLDGAIADFSQAIKLNPAFNAAQKSLTLAEQEKQELGRV